MSVYKFFLFTFRHSLVFDQVLTFLWAASGAHGHIFIEVKREKFFTLPKNGASAFLFRDIDIALVLFFIL